MATPRQQPGLVRSTPARLSPQYYRMQSQELRAFEHQACEECRKRKLKCDRRRPCCGPCHDAGVSCHVNESRQRRGPKKGHMKAMRTRLATLEGLFNRGICAGASAEAVATAIETHTTTDVLGLHADDAALELTSSHEPVLTSSAREDEVDHLFGLSCELETSESPPREPPDLLWSLADMPWSNNTTLPCSPSPARSLVSVVSTIDLGMLSDHVRAELNHLYFDRVHPVVPIIHQVGYFSQQSTTQQSVDSTPHAALQYAMWALATCSSAQFQELRERLHAHARLILEGLESNELFAASPSVEQAQAWLLVAHYEFCYFDFQRAWITMGRAFRVIQLLRMHEIDKQILPTPAVSLSPEDWTKLEEQRRTFWVAYTLDRYVSICRDWPLGLHEETICTRLPAPEADFQHSRPVQMSFLPMAIESSGETMLPPLTESIVLATLCRRRRLVAPSVHASADHRGFADSAVPPTPRCQGLYQMVKKRIALLKLPVSSMELFDPMRLFTNMLAHAVLIYLSDQVLFDTAGEAHTSVEAYQQMLVETLESVCDLISLVKGHKCSSVFVYIAIKFLRDHPNLPSFTSLTDMARETHIKELMVALRVLQDGNNLAREYLGLLDVENLSDPWGFLSLCPSGGLTACWQQDVDRT
ncbi:fungal-specific transcription factor domain-containing protein [Podospora appendiculata]|uniref:Fungal-specific transcription factor domain-containing protein n=1 Tax=Podospora appendiculata TaxID=314037 RepID=A0AAE0X253_9PEZI|nr:fungal-specific transcription factor domain-containing protein [Podospora appendiculata]